MLSLKYQAAMKNHKQYKVCETSLKKMQMIWCAMYNHVKNRSMKNTTSVDLQVTVKTGITDVSLMFSLRVNFVI